MDILHFGLCVYFVCLVFVWVHVDRQDRFLKRVAEQRSELFTCAKQ